MSGLSENERLWLHEEVLLVALHDEKGSMQASSTCGFAMAGAMFAELMLMGRLSIAGEGKKQTVAVADPAATGNPLLDECLAMVSESSKPRKPADWMWRFARVKNLRDRVADDLITLGAIRKEEGKVLVIFPVTRYPEVDASYEAEVSRRLAETIFGDEPVDDPRTATLVALLDGAQMLSLVFSRKDLKARKARLEAISSGDAAGEAVTAAVRAMQAAVLTACTAGATVAAIS
jgi:hypothetical protein